MRETHTIMKWFVGYIPAMIVFVPFVTAFVRQSLYYQGCMDGFEFVMVAMAGFVLGGIINVIFLLCVLMSCRLRQREAQCWMTAVKRGGIGVAIFTFLFQVSMLAWIFYQKWIA